MRETEEQLAAANHSLDGLRVQFEQLSAELRDQLSSRASELQEQQQVNEQLQKQLKNAEDAKQQAEGHCQELQRNLERLTQVHSRQGAEQWW